MLETAFTLWGAAVTWLEVLAFVLALANIACNVYEIHWGWPLTIIASGLYAWLFYASGLFGESGVNIFFMAAALWGWWQWLHGHRANDSGPLRITFLNTEGRIWLALGWLGSWVVLALVLRHYTRSDVPWMDGFVTAGSLVGTVLIGRKFIENWLVWMLVNIVSVALFWHKELYLTAILYVIFFGMAIWGWNGWRARFRQQRMQARQ